MTIKKLIHRIFYINICIIAVSFSSIHAQEFSAKKIKKHIKYLASDKLEGRGTGTAGEQKSAAYLIKQFKKAGLQPYGEKGGFLQGYPAKKGLPPNITYVQTANVVGYLDNNADRTIVIGAHYDHLGKGDQGSSLQANSVGEIHNGADDNASGTAGLIELAKYYSGNNITEKHNFLFIAFSGEELGLMGSKFYCDNPTIDLKTVNCMFNMDMIGRYRADKGVTIGGFGTSSFWGNHAKDIANKVGLNYNIDSSGVGPSDHTSFYLKDIPVMFLFTGGHQQYHKPTDDANLINSDGEAKLLEYIANVIAKLDESPKIDFKKTTTPHARGAASSFKVTLGVMPDYSYDKGGLKLDDVQEDRPAFNSGIKAGDIILQLGDVKVRDIYDYMEALGKYEKGQTVKVTFKRGTEVITKDLTF
jgi:Zn-dependent M28 family amino/carboxypeptidase